ncbi:response regulator transcription factor [Mobilitalea sibirica]|nr:response regulator transcription factor [Mobilitalea sibirica]
MKVVIVDDHRLLRDSLKNMIEHNSNIDVVACASDGNEAYKYCEKYKPDVILMDILMPICNGLEATKKIKSKYPDTKILILTASTDDFNLTKALNNGADGYILKDVGKDELILSIESTAKGLGIIHRDFLNHLKNDKNIDTDETKKELNSTIIVDGIEVALTKQQQQILKMIVKGYNNKQISQELFLAEGTVKNNISEIISKFQLKDRTQLAVFAIKYNLV